MTGLDYFGARYYSGNQGRFTSPDEFKGGGLFDPSTGLSAEVIGALPYADISDPQTLSKYAYVRNNPLRYVDPDGHGFMDWLRTGAQVVGGAFQGAAASVTWGAVGKPSASDTLPSRVGQAIGAGVIAHLETDAAASGAVGGIVTSETGVGAVVGAAVAVAGAVAAVGAARDLGAILTTPIQSNSNPLTGQPGSTSTTTQPNGDVKQERTYGQDGYPQKDVDYGHDHGQGDPHVHDWGRPSGGGPPTHQDRAPGRPPDKPQGQGQQ